MIEIRSLSKRYGATVAVDDLDVTIPPGRVTGFLGPNGAGKSTSLRMLLGLVHPTAGTATIAGRAYRDLDAPLRTVGALLDGRAFHPGRTARAHLTALAATHGIGRRRVDAVLDQVGLAERADARAGTFSLGMGQRLGIAAALLGDPEVLVLDEPINGLDTDGIRWVRDLVRGLAAEGRTVLVSSHQMAEVEQSVDHLVVIGRGRLLADAPVEEVIRRGSGTVVRVASPSAALPVLLERAGAVVAPDTTAPDRADRRRASDRPVGGPGGTWVVTGCEAAAIGALAAGAGIALHRLEPVRSSLEDVYTELTRDAVVHRAGADR